MRRTAAAGPGSHRRYGSAVARQRLDTLLAERGIFPSRTAAASSVRAGEVQLGADGRVALKPGQLVPDDAELVVAEKPRFVSRGGIKLQNAIDSLGLDLEGRDCLDVGASTGGFTDCLLQNGAARVISTDVATGQLEWGLRNASRVTVLEGVNARELRPGDLPFVPEFATIDVSFISLAKVLPTVVSTLAPQGEVLAMVKPQFELGKGRVGRGGVVRSAGDRREALLLVADAALRLDLPVRGFAASGLPGPKGNLETFVWCGGDGPGIEDVEAAAREVEP
jgi:23S rRNA (cytidine1920-2'-O)/16S rRNA (cytidine1409-2'-O)-methyltransferase